MLSGSQPPPVAALRAELARRRRQRFVACFVCAAAAMVVAAFFLTDRNLRPQFRIVPLVAGTGSGNSSPVVDPRGGSSMPDRDADMPIAAAEGNRAPFAAIAVLIPQTGADGAQELVPAWYVPGEVQEIDALSLSPAERRAVSELLGPDYDFGPDEII
jgi:hypothetical protein